MRLELQIWKLRGDTFDAMWKVLSVYTDELRISCHLSRMQEITVTSFTLVHSEDSEFEQMDGRTK